MIQFIIPDEWGKLYKRLLNLMVLNGLDTTKDCSKGCDSGHLKLIECWNIFQSACCAYVLGMMKEAQFLYKYVYEQILCTYGEYIPEEDEEDDKLYYATDEDIDDIIDGNFITDNTPDSKYVDFNTDEDIDNIIAGIPIIDTTIDNPDLEYATDNDIDEITK